MDNKTTINNMNANIEILNKAFTDKLNQQVILKAVQKSSWIDLELGSNFDIMNDVFKVNPGYVRVEMRFTGGLDLKNYNTISFFPEARARKSNESFHWDILPLFFKEVSFNKVTNEWNIIN